MRASLIFFFIVSSIICGFWFASLASWRLSANEVCTLLSQHYYRAEDPEAAKLIARCYDNANHTMILGLTRSHYLDRLNQLLDPFMTSHLSIYSPKEHTHVWQHEAVDTGMRARLIDGHYVIYKILSKSPGEEAGVKTGDDILSVDNLEITTLAQITNTSGEYVLMRRQPGSKLAQKLKIKIQARTYQEDRSPRLLPLKNGIGLLEIGSFLPQYFEKTSWKMLASGLQAYTKIVVDLRDNQGGSFPAMLRALSPFRCEHPDVGTVRRGIKEASAGQETLADELDDGAQLEVLDRQKLTVLRTYEEYPCFPGPVVVLTDPGTASVAELYAAAFLTRSKSAVLGQSTAGQLVMAQWFPLNSINEYSLSIPIASVWTDQNIEIEARGVYPQVDLFYNLEDALGGMDSWVVSAIRYISKERPLR